MSIFDLSQDENRQKLTAGMLDPFSYEPEDPGVFKGASYGIGMGLARGGARTFQTVGILGGVPQMAQDAIFGTDTTDRYFSMVDRYGTSAVDYWTPRPSDVGKIGQIGGGLAEIAAPLAVTGGNPAALIANQQTGTSVDLVREGVDANTAVVAGTASGVGAALGFKVAGYGSNIWQRMASGAAGNVAVGAGTTKAERTILEKAGYGEIAKNFDSLDPTARAADVIIGAAFGAIQPAGGRPPAAVIDAALAARNTEAFLASQPGRPKNAASDIASQQALAAAFKALNEGAPVDVAPIVKGASWDLSPKAEMLESRWNARGIRNNNPGNIELSKTSWQGAVQGVDPRFVTFDTPEAGIRALGKNLLTYQDKYGLNTVEGIVNRWAPPGENNTGAYVQSVAQAVGVDPKTPLNLRDPATLQNITGAIIQHENGGNPYRPEQIKAGVDSAITGKEIPKAWTGDQEIALNAKLKEAQDLTKQAADAPQDNALMAKADEAANAAEDMRLLKETSSATDSAIPSEPGAGEPQISRPTENAQVQPESAGATAPTPEMQAAQRTVELNPDMRVTLEDGRTLTAREAHEESQADIEQATKDAGAFQAAISCLMGG